MATIKITPVVAPVVVERDSSKTERVYTPDILNGTGATLLKGTAVRVDSGDGSLKLADASSLENAKITGFVAADTAAGESERVIIAGVADYILEPGNPALVPGQQLYLSSTAAGKVTSVPPQAAGNVTVPLGRAHGNQIFVEVGTGILRS